MQCTWAKGSFLIFQGKREVRGVGLKSTFGFVQVKGHEP